MARTKNISPHSNVAGRKIKKHKFKKGGMGTYKMNPAYLTKPALAKLYLDFAQTSAEYRLFEYDITPFVIDYIKDIAEDEGCSPLQVLRRRGINPDYMSKFMNGKKICSYRYAMFLVHKIGRPITLIA